MTYWNLETQNRIVPYLGAYAKTETVIENHVC